MYSFIPLLGHCSYNFCLNAIPFKYQSTFSPEPNIFDRALKVNCETPFPSTPFLYQDQDESNDNDKDDQCPSQDFSQDWRLEFAMKFPVSGKQSKHETLQRN